MASQDARLSMFEANFKQQQSEMTNKIDIVLKAIPDRITGALPSDTVKNLKLNVNSTSPVFSAHSYPTGDPQCSSHPLISINAIKTCSKETNHSQKDQLQTVTEIITRQTKEPKQTLEDEFKDLHLNLPVLKVLAHAPMYNAILDKYVESLELGKNGSAFIRGKMPKRMENPGLFTLPCRLEDSKPFDTLAQLGSCVNIIPLYLFKKLNIGLLEETGHVFELADGTKSYLVEIVRDVEVHIVRLKILNNFYVIDMKEDPKTTLLVEREFLATANAVIACRKAKIVVGEGITRKFFKKNKEEIFTVAGDGIRIYPDGIAFGGNTCDLRSFREETDKNTTLHHLSWRIVHTEHGDGVADFKRRRQDFQSDSVMDLATASEQIRLKMALEDSTWRRRHDYNTTP
nr:hypothetical protein [Tanacetum cinerariifolium]